MKKTIYLLVLIAMQGLFTTARSQTPQWAGVYGGPGEDVVAGIHTDPDGNMYSTGYFSDSCDFDLTDATSVVEHGLDFEIFVSKYDSSGALQWVKTFGGANGENGVAVTTDNSGNVYVTGVYQDAIDFDPGDGEFFMSPAGFLDTFVVKLDANGTFVWAKSISGIDYEQANGIGTDSQDNVYLAGFFFSTTDFDPGAAEYNLTPAGFHDCFAVKLDSSGNFVWAKQFGGANFDYVTALKVTDAGEMNIVGTFSGAVDFNPDPAAEFLLSTSGNDGCFLARLDSQGNFVGATKVGESSVRVFGMSIDIDNQGDALISGYFGGVLDIGMADNTVTTFNSGDFFNGYIVKVSNAGQVIWAKPITGDAGALCYGVATNSLNEVFLGGFFTGTLTSGTASLTQQNTTAAFENFMVKLDTNGNTMNAYQFGGADFVDGFPISIDQSDNVYLSTAFEHTIDLSPMPDTAWPITAVANRDVFVIKMDNTTLSNPDFDLGSFAVYPNPANAEITVHSNTDLAGMRYSLTDMTGRTILSGTLNGSKRIDIGALPQGTYVLAVGQMHRKVIKQ